MSLKKATSDYIEDRLNWFNYTFKKETEISIQRVTVLSRSKSVAEKRLFDLNKFNQACERPSFTESITHKPEDVMKEIFESEDYVQLKMYEICISWLRLQLAKKDKKEIHKALLKLVFSKDIKTKNYYKELLKEKNQQIKILKYDYKKLYDKLSSMAYDSLY